MPETGLRRAALALALLVALSGSASALDMRSTGGTSGGGITGGTTAIGTCGNGRLMYDDGGVVGCDPNLIWTEGSSRLSIADGAESVLRIETNDTTGTGQSTIYPSGTDTVENMSIQSAGGGTMQVIANGVGAGMQLTAADYIALSAGGAITVQGASFTMSNSPSPLQITTSGQGIEFVESDTNPACASGNFTIYADTSEAKLKKCTNGTVSDLAAVGANSVALTTDTTGDYVASIGTGSEGATFTKSGNTTVIGTTSGTLTSGNGLKIDASGNIVDSGGPFAVGGGSTAAPVGIVLPNAGTTGTTANKLAKIKTDGTLVITATTDTVGAIGPVIAGAGTTGSATVLLVGQANCVFDGATTAGDYVGISPSVAGDCTDLGSTFPSNQAVLGIVTTTNGSGGTYAVIFQTPDIQNTTNIKGGGAGKGQIGDLLYSGKLNITGIVAVSSSASVAATTRIESCTSGASAITRTLPAATGSGRVVDLVKIDSGAGTCIFGRTGDDTLNGATTRTLSAQYKADTCMDIAADLWLCRGDGT
jgi:hypothetical protein